MNKTLYREDFLKRKTCQGKHTDCFHLKGIFDDCRKPRSQNEDLTINQRLLYCAACRKYKSGKKPMYRAPKINGEIFSLIPEFVYKGIEKYKDQEKKNLLNYQKFLKSEKFFQYNCFG